MQAKRTVSQAGDPAELEADRMADQVTQFRDSPGGGQRVDRPSGGVSAPVNRLVSRKCDACEEEKEPHAARNPVLDYGTGTLDVGDAGAQNVELGLRSAAEPLDASTRSFMEPRFGIDFTRVRVHTGATATESARTLNALAYTVGEDIVFGAKQYSPGTERGRRLLSHELAHVVQQRGAVQSASGGGGAANPQPGSAEVQVHRATADPAPASTAGGQNVGKDAGKDFGKDAGSAIPQGPQKGCECDPAAICNDPDISGPAFKGFQLAATWLGPAEQKIKDYKSAPGDPKNAKAAKALRDHFSWTGPDPLSPDIPKIILSVIGDVRAGMGKCAFFADCSSTSGTESGKIHAGSPTAWSQTNCYEFYPPFKKDGPPSMPDGGIFQAQIVLHEVIHSWESVGRVETYETEGPPKYPPPAASAQDNPDSFACLIRDLR
jgi:hypothetical protein